jgi:hypothetical protein
LRSRDGARQQHGGKTAQHQTKEEVGPNHFDDSLTASARRLTQCKYTPAPAPLSSPPSTSWKWAGVACPRSRGHVTLRAPSSFQRFIRVGVEEP